MKKELSGLRQERNNLKKELFRKQELEKKRLALERKKAIQDAKSIRCKQDNLRKHDAKDSRAIATLEKTLKDRNKVSDLIIEVISLIK